MTALLQYARELRVFNRFERNLAGNVALRQQDGAAANNDRELKRAFQDMLRVRELSESETLRDRAQDAIADARFAMEGHKP